MVAWGSCCPGTQVRHPAPFCNLQRHARRADPATFLHRLVHTRNPQPLNPKPLNPKRLKPKPLSLSLSHRHSKPLNPKSSRSGKNIVGNLPGQAHLRVSTKFYDPISKPHLSRNSRIRPYRDDQNVRNLKIAEVLFDREPKSSTPNF